MQVALPGLNVQSMPLSGPVPGGYGPHLGSAIPIFPGQATYPPSVPSGKIYKYKSHILVMCVFLGSCYFNKCPCFTLCDHVF